MTHHDDDNAPANGPVPPTPRVPDEPADGAQQDHPAQAADAPQQAGIARQAQAGQATPVPDQGFVAPGHAPAAGPAAGAAAVPPQPPVAHGQPSADATQNPYAPTTAQATPNPYAAHNPYATAPADPSAPKKGLGTGALLGIVGGGLVLLIVLALLVVVGIRSLAGSSDEPEAGGELGPADTVTSYLSALSEGDSALALTFIGEPEDSTLLTDEVLAASLDRSPIADIEIVSDESDEMSGDVTASYTLGGEPITASYGVQDYDRDGVWTISGGLSYLSLAKFAGLGLTVNGQEVDVEQTQVFPGSYEFAMADEDYAITGEPVVTVTTPFESADLGDLSPGLSESAVETFRALVTAEVDACVASTTLAAGCGLELQPTLSDGTQMAEGTIVRTLSADTITTLGSMVPKLSYDNPTLAQGEFLGGVTVAGTCTKNGATGSCSVLFGPSLGRPSVDMSAETPTVLWD